MAPPHAARQTEGEAKRPARTAEGWPAMPERRASLPAATAPRPTAIADFVLARWRAEIPLGRDLWWDMGVVGALFTLATGLVALLLLPRALPLAVAAAVSSSPLPLHSTPGRP